MDRNTIIGFILIFAIIIAWQQFMKPSAEQIEAEQRFQDSLAMVQARQDSLAQLNVQTGQPAADPESVTSEVPQIADSVVQAQQNARFGLFAPASTGTEQTYELENELMRITFSNKGGKITQVELKEYKKVTEDEKSKEVYEPLLLLEDEKNKFEYLLPVPSASTGVVSTEDLYFEADKEGDQITFRAPAGPGSYFEQTYRLVQDYDIDYEINAVGLNGVLDPTTSTIELNWVNYLDKLEKNVSYERNYSTIYFKPTDDSADNCSCTGDDTEVLEGEPIKWISNTNQFFNSTLIADNAFRDAVLETTVLEEGAPDLKKLQSRIKMPLQESGSFGMEWYIGPNEFERLAAYNMDLQDVIPFGWTIFGTVNRWVIRPVFSFLNSFIGSAGLVILMLTLIVKIALFPLTYRMLYSQSKMGVLKPYLADMKEKFKDDPQKQQMESMKVYQEYGVNPLGGCLPVVLQMPIWFALYRFFPASIEFRQESFLWATDLSSYDVAFSLPFEIPFYGDHVSMFTILWAITTVIYTYYNSRHMDMSVNPAMKYMQYFMPVMFLFFFNNFAAGLTCYLLFSNILNITQTLVTKNYIISEEKIRQELEKNKAKPKKKGGFQNRLQKALQEQQKVQTERETGKKKGGPKSNRSKKK